MATKMGIDTTRWQKKLIGVYGALNDAMEVATQKGSDIVLKETVKNVSGLLHSESSPSPTPGQLPVSRITGMLKQSITRVRLAKDLMIIYPNVQIAPYAAAVHDGTKDVDNAVLMKRRPFLYEAVRLTRDKVAVVLKNEFLNVIRKYGLR
jgi:hypothetical protein